MYGLKAPSTSQSHDESIYEDVSFLFKSAN